MNDSGKYQIQVEKEHYDFKQYVDQKRWMSYYYQIREAVASGCSSFLVVGKGDGIVSSIISEILCLEDCIVDTYDFDDRLYPTYIGDIRNLNSVVKKEYDCIICCQVLEHLEWQYFEKIIEQISSICNSRTILSLPMHRLAFSLIIDFPKFHNKVCNVIIPRFWKKKWIFKGGGEHYWEVGIKNRRKKDILRVVKRHFNIVREYVVPENTYHWFIILEKN